MSLNVQSGDQPNTVWAVAKALFNIELSHASDFVGQPLATLGDLEEIRSNPDLAIRLDELLANDSNYQALKSWVDIAGKQVQELLDEKFSPEMRRRKDQWSVKYGYPYPETPDDLKRLAARSGVPGDEIFYGNFAPADVLPGIEGYLQRIQDGKPLPDEILDEDHIDILTALGESGDVMSQEEIADASGYNRKRVAKRLKWLFSINAVAQPIGKRRKYAITSKGRELLLR